MAFERVITMAAHRRKFAGRVVNLSATGLLLHPATRIPAGTGVQLLVELPGQSRPLALHGRVVREMSHEGLYAVGVEFGLLPAPVVAVLIGFVAARRETLGKTMPGPRSRRPTHQRSRDHARAPLPREAAAPAARELLEDVPEHEANQADELVAILRSQDQLETLYQEAVKQVEENSPGRRIAMPYRRKLSWG